MCFSAPASFIVSASLATVSTIAIKKSATSQQRFFAGIPMLFAVQQFCEGGVWLSLMHPAYAHLYTLSTYVFLVFAQVVWPTYVPLSILLLEQNPRRRSILHWGTAIGIFTSAWLLYCMLFYPVSATVESGHIKYDLDFPIADKWYTGIPYVLAIVVSPFFSSVKRMSYVSLVLLASFLVTRVFFSDHLISVWCYFAATVSALVLWIIIELRKEKQTGTS